MEAGESIKGSCVDVGYAIRISRAVETIYVSFCEVDDSKVSLVPGDEMCVKVCSEGEDGIDVVIDGNGVLGPIPWGSFDIINEEWAEKNRVAAEEWQKTHPSWSAEDRTASAGDETPDPDNLPF